MNWNHTCINKYIQKVTTLGYQLAMIIHDNFQFHPPVVSEKKIFKNFSQSETITSPDSHVEKVAMMVIF
jgi:hypothetical protein